MADWVELIALVSDDKNSGRGDLEQILRRSGTFDGPHRNADEEIDLFCLEVFSELERRAHVLADAYPFAISGGVIQRDAAFVPRYVPYIFCLCLSYFGDRGQTAALKPRLMFEEISAYAAGSYLNGEYLVFGTSRSGTGSTHTGFKAAINGLAKFLGEGEGFLEQDTLSKKDDHIDVVVVKHFADRATSKIVLFGQCASGDNWKGKIAEMQPDPFWGQWMQTSAVSPLIRSFFVPHSIAAKDWDYHARYGGVFFDRARIAFWASRSDKISTDSSRYSTWVDSCLSSLA